MKIRNYILGIFTLLAGAAAVVSCDKEDAVANAVIATDKATYTATADGGSVDILLSSNVSWTATLAPASSNDNIDDVTLSPSSGAASDTPQKVTVTFGPNSKFNRSAVITFQGKYIAAATSVTQAGPKGDYMEELTIGEFLDRPVDNKIYYAISGKVTKIASSATYSNFYLNDGTGEIYVYGLYDGKGGPQIKDGELDRLGIKVGYTMTIGATRGVYGSTPEAVYAYVIEYSEPKEPIMTVDVPSVTVDADVTSAKFSVSTMNLKSDWTVTPAESYSWVKDYTQSGRQSGDIVISLEPNEDKENERVAKFTLANADCAAIELTLTQKKASAELKTITVAEYLALPEDDTNVYQVAGVVSGVKTDGSDKYGNFYISDKTGKLYIYGFVGRKGGSTKNFVNVQSEMGLKDGDYLVVQGERSVYKGTPQVKNAWYMSHYASKTAAEFNALADNNDVFYTISGEVTSIANDTYGNVYVKDATGEIYIYGILDWDGKTKNFKSLGIKVGDKITGYSIKTSYKDAAQAKNMQIVLIEPAAEGGEGGSGSQGGDAATTDKGFKAVVTAFPSAYANDGIVKCGNAECYANQVANYGNGIQFKKEVSYFANKTKFSKPIKSITIVVYEGKELTAENVVVYYGSAEKPADNKVEAKGDKTTLTFDLSGKDASFFKLANIGSYAMYLDSIEVVLAD